MNNREINKRNKITRHVLGLVVVLAIFIFSNILAPLTVSATINKQINYQGKLTTPSNVAVTDAGYNMTFKLYTVSTGGSSIWTETFCYSPDNGATCNGTGVDKRVSVTNGLFSTMLGSVTSLVGVDFSTSTWYLGVTISGTSTTPTAESEMTPRKIIGSVPSAFVADTLQGLTPSSFFRTDAANSTSSASTYLSVAQAGAGKIAEFFGLTSSSVLSILSNGNINATGTLNIAGVGNFTYLTTSSSTATSTFAGRLSALNLSGTNTGDLTIGTGNGLSLASQTISLALASTTGTGALSSTDWNTFNNKLSTTTAASTYVSYTGANADVDLGTHNVTTTGTGTFNIIQAGGIAYDLGGDWNGIQLASSGIVFQTGDTARGRWDATTGDLDLYGNDLVTTGTGTFGAVNFGSATGVSATATNGVLTFAGLGDGADQDLTFDFNTSATAVVIASGAYKDLDLTYFTNVNTTVLKASLLVGTDKYMGADGTTYFANYSGGWELNNIQSIDGAPVYNSGGYLGVTNGVTAPVFSVGGGFSSGYTTVDSTGVNTNDLLTSGGLYFGYYSSGREYYAKITPTGTGILDFAGYGGSNNGDLQFDFETTPSVVGISSTNGVALVNWGSLNLSTSGTIGGGAGNFTYLTTSSTTATSTFAGRLSALNLSGTNTGDLTIGTGNGLSLASQAISLALASTTGAGALSSTDWNTFNNKLSTTTAASTYVSYTGANADVDLGTHNVTTTGAISAYYLNTDAFGSWTNSVALAGYDMGSGWLLSNIASINGNPVLTSESDPAYTTWYNSGTPTLASLVISTGTGTTLTDNGGWLGITNGVTVPVVEVGGFGSGGTTINSSGVNTNNIITYGLYFGSGYGGTYYDAKITPPGVGLLNFAGYGGSNDEDLQFDFETTPNVVGISSTSGVALVNWGSLNLSTSGTIGGGAITGTSLTSTGGTISLTNGTSNQVQFGTAGVSAPGASSAGMKLKLYGTNGAMGASDYAMGVETGTMWFNTDASYKWYEDSTLRMTLAGANLSVTGTIDGTAITGTSLSAGSGTISTSGTVQAPTINGGTSANDDITIQGTTNATRTTSYVNLQPNGGNVGIGTTSPSQTLDVNGIARVGSLQGSKFVDMNFAGSTDTEGAGQNFYVYPSSAGQDINLWFGKSSNKWGYVDFTNVYAVTGMPALTVKGQLSISNVSNLSTIDFGDGWDKITAGTANKMIVYGYSGTQFNDSTGITASIGTAGSLNSYFLGNVGIGTTNPIKKLELTGDFQIDLKPGTVSGKHLWLESNNGYAQISTDSGALFFSAASIQYSGDLLPDGDSARSLGNAGRYWTNTYTDSLFTTGNVGIGTSTPGQTLTVVGGAQFTGVGSGATANDLRITSDGTLTTNTSDQRLKDNILTLSASTLDKVMQLNPVSFTWKGDTSGVRDLGFIAQEVQTLFPETVFQNPTDGYYGINYSRFPAILTKAIQELNAKVDALGTSTISAASLGVNQSLLSSVTEWVGQKITATFGFFTEITADKVKVNKGIEMKDQDTGAVYCIVLKSGEFVKTQGTCQDTSATAAVGLATPEVPAVPVLTETSTTTSTTTPTTTPTATPVVEPVAVDTPSDMASSTQETQVVPEVVLDAPAQ